jgi:glycosyltransferase involved in cell wall biosynthesis
MHVGFAPYRGDQPFHFSPLKLYENMAAGLQVKAIDCGDLARIIGAAGAGEVVAPDRPDLVAAALVALAADPAGATALGAAGRAHVAEQHGWARVLDRILDGLGPALRGAT